MLDRTMRKRTLLLALAAGCLLPLLPAAAQDQPVLQIEGGAVQALDLDQLKGLGLVTFDTTTAWIDGKVVFEAVPGERLLAAIGDRGQVVAATANDGYTVEIPVEDFRTGKARLAVAMNGQPLAPDEFGPFWIVYDYDSTPELAGDAYVARSIWQLKSLTLR
jgi:hypothetical protein